MTLSPKARESQARLAEDSRPGSVEARHVHSCTCTSSARTYNRAIAWMPDYVAEWADLVNVHCPAHGRLLERWAVDQAMQRVVKSQQKRRSGLQRFADALWSGYLGFLEGWSEPW